jgi:hypothetical protein
MLRLLIIWVILIFLLISTVGAQDDSGLVLNSIGAYEGYTLFAPLNASTTYLIDNMGRLVHTWESAYTPGNAVYLLENGHLMRTANDRSSYFNAGGAGGRVEEYTWEGDLLWDFAYSTDSYRLHHDIEVLPNGNVLMIAWERKTAQEAVAAGRDPALIPEEGELWVDHLIEVNPATDAIVWEWHIWDHLIQDYDADKANYGAVAEHPDRIDLNYVSGQVVADWNHINAVDYHPVTGQILLSVHSFDEIWVIDHGSGDLLYRWGNPQAYGAEGDQQLYAQHDAQWITSGLPGEGNILIFNNGERRGRAYSSVDEIVPPVDDAGHYTGYGPDAPVWSYADPEHFYGENISGVQRLPNGNTLICEGPSGRIFEVTSAGEIVWEYVNPIFSQSPQGPRNSVFRAERYAPDFAGFVDRDLAPGTPIEASEVGSPSPPEGGPPVQAVESCNDKSEGDACEFTGKRGVIKGTCQTRDGQRVCVPANR